MKKNSVIVCLVILASLLLAGGCAPASFVKGHSAGWKTIELNESLMHNYDTSWQKTVDTIARDYDIEMMDKDSSLLEVV